MAHCTKSDVDRVYVARQKGGRGLLSSEMCVKTEENNLVWYVRNSNERLMAGVRKIKILDSEGTKEKNEVKSDRQNVSLNRWKEKKMYGQFLREMPETVDEDKTWEWTRKSDLKVETEALIFAAQEQALRTNYVKFNIGKPVDSPGGGGGYSLIWVIRVRAAGQGMVFRPRCPKQGIQFDLPLS